LDAAGNTTAAIGKGFAIGSAALVALALYGGFLHNAHLEDREKTPVNLTQPTVFAGLLLGAMLPYVFSALTMKSVGKAALGMVQEVRRQIADFPGILTGDMEPDYRACIRISTRASLREMILPGLLVTIQNNEGHPLPAPFRDCLRPQNDRWVPARCDYIGSSDGYKLG
jgi:Na+/H+-translocating membrane pyrophosphatase